MEAEFVIEALEAAEKVSYWVCEYMELREDMADCLSRGYNLSDELVKRLDDMEQSEPISELTNLLIRATDTDCKVAGWSALIARSREAVNNLCGTFEEYEPQDGELVKAAMKLLRTVQDLEKRKATISRKSTTTTQPKHFNSPQSKEKLETIFQRLKDDCYFDDSADLETWLYICGVGDLNGDFRPLNWIESAALLGYLVDKMKLQASGNKRWKTTAHCFIVKGKTINTKNLTVSISKGVKNNNPKRDIIDRIVG